MALRPDQFIDHTGIAMTDLLGRHAIVVGAGIGGLTAAKALSSYFGSVTVLERDAFSSTRVKASVGARSRVRTRWTCQNAGPVEHAPHSTTEEPVLTQFFREGPTLTRSQLAAVLAKFFREQVRAAAGYGPQGGQA
jgi:glycine/D-amino acid oxidase-like deaminating enzyme